MRLTEEYKRITEHFKDLQAKFSHFQQADLNKYQAVRPPHPKAVFSNHIPAVASLLGLHPDYGIWSAVFEAGPGSHPLQSFICTVQSAHKLV